MAKAQPPPVHPGNHLLAYLPQAEYQRLAPLLQTVPLPLKQVLYKARSPISYVYFPIRGVVSAMTIMEDGRAIEVATVGSEGMIGLTAFLGSATSPNEVMVQAEGRGCG